MNYTRTLDAFSASDTLDLREVGFMIAFGVADFWTGESLHDSKYVQWNVQIQTGLNQKWGDKTPLTYHRCSQTDLD